MLRQRSKKFHLFVSSRVNQAQPFRMESLPDEPEIVPAAHCRCRTRAVYIVADKRVIDIGHMNADLVCPSRFEFNPQKRSSARAAVRETFANEPMCNRFTRTGRSGRVHRHAFSVRFVPCKRRINGSAVLSEIALAQSAVGSCHRMGLQLVRKKIVSIVILCNDQQS